MKYSNLGVYTFYNIIIIIIIIIIIYCHFTSQWMSSFKSHWFCLEICSAPANSATVNWFSVNKSV